MKRKQLILSILATLYLSGCTLEAPLDLGVKCSDESRKLSAVVYAGMVCHPEDVVSGSRNGCSQFADAFKYGYCPGEYFCIVDQQDAFICSTTSCLFTQHERNGKCEENTVRDCGQAGYECELNTAGWIDGYCESDVSEARCFATECDDGYQLDKVKGQCTALMECQAGEHIYAGTCEADSVENCGRHGYSCASYTAGWKDGACIEGICTPSACETGYRLEEGACVSLIHCDDDQHIYNGECEADTLSHCGLHGNDCHSLEGWEDGNCKDSRCFATACSKGYELREDTGMCRVFVAKCDDKTQHVYDNTCENNDIYNCGRHDYACEQLSGWLNGICEEGECVATACVTGYELEDGKCVAKTSCDNPDEHYYNGDCIPNDLDNCGMHAYSCSYHVSGWEDGACTSGVCVATACEIGYNLVDGSCVANTSCEDPDTHYYHGECIENDLDNCGKHNNRCADITGWGDGTCVAGVCVPSTCIIGYHLNAEGSACIADDAENCGRVGNRCGAGEVCTAGECRDNCGTGEVRCENEGVVSCADPMTSTAYCGADASCGGYQICAEGQACVNGNCVQNACYGEKTLCVVNGENQCISLESNNANHCGACNLKCEAQQVANAHSNTCLEGKCQFECNTDYTNCGTASVPNCISNANFANDSNNCGGCGKTCHSDEFCNGGTCKKSTCTNSCLSNSTCVNEADKCGTQCIDCNTANNASQGSCSTAGVCTIVKCAPGYHLQSDGQCGQNTATACGSVSSANAINCTSSNNATDGYCDMNGACVSTSCKTGYHVENGVCTKDGIQACGASKLDCTTLPGWKGGACTGGVCVANACQSGYCLMGATCVDGSYNSLTCGVAGGTATCTNCGSGKACSAGACIQSSCDANVCFYQGTVCSNTEEHCGSACTNCNVANNASAGTCNNGTCKITKCASGYHLAGSSSNYSCEQNTATKCGKSNSTTTKDCTSADHAAAGTCGVDGTCIITSCVSGYHLNAGACVADGPTACGANGVNCTDLDGWSLGTCTGGKCVATACDPGYCLNGNTCVNGSANSMMCAVNGSSAACSACGSNQACVSGACVQSGCDANVCFYQGATCSNTADHCGSTCTNCNSAGNAASGTCNNGACKITKCAAGYHLQGSSGNYSCAVNTASSCGSVSTANAVNCNTQNHATSGICNSDGTCTATACASGYHLKSGKCVGDSVSECGAGAVNCNALEGWNGGACTGGQCVANACDSGYCLHNGTCVDGSYNSKMCGISGTCSNCDTATTNKSCSNGQCVLSGCSSNVCFYQGTTCSNTAEHCGSTCTNCKTANHAANGTCTSSGTCKITACAVGYHLSGGNCVADSATSCGSTAVNCMNTNHAASGVCNVNGTCTITSCVAGYHLYNGTCEANSNTSCGFHGDACDTANAFYCNAATAQCECPSGYTLDGGKCVKNSNEVVCDENNYATVVFNGSVVRAYCIKSKEDFQEVIRKRFDKPTFPEDNSQNAYILMNDIEIGTYNYSPFNSLSDGIFLGNNHLIRGSLSCSDNCGFFEELKSAMVDSLHLELDVDGGDANVGSLAYSISNSTISNVHSVSNVHSGMKDAGGFAITIDSSTLIECSHIGDVTTDNNAAGGFATTISNSSIIDSYSSGNIDGMICNGGFAGNARNGIVIYNSTFIGTVNGDSDNGGIVGCIDAGDAISTISGSSVINSNIISVFHEAGGMVGINEGNLMIVSSVFNGEVHTDWGSDDDTAGGLVGWNAGNLTIDQSGVFGFVYGGGDTEFGGGMIGKSDSSDLVVKSSFVAADLKGFINAAQIGTVNKIVFHEGYSTGAFENIKNTISTDILKGTFSGYQDHSPYYFYWFEGATNSQFSVDPVYYSGSTQCVWSPCDSLTDELNYFYKTYINNYYEPWETRTCTFDSPIDGLKGTYEIAVPKTMPAVSICTK